MRKQSHKTSAINRLQTYARTSPKTSAINRLQTYARTSPKTSAINRLQTYARTLPRHRVIAQITNILKVNRKITKNLKVTPKMVQVSVRALHTRINPFIPNASALYPLKSSEEESRVRGIGKKWVNGLAKFF